MILDPEEDPAAPASSAPSPAAPPLVRPEVPKPRPRRGGRGGAFAILLLSVLAWWGGESLRTTTWWTFDEPTHVKAARELREGHGVISNFEHPVLMKVVGAAGLRPARAGTTIEAVRDARRLFPVLFGALVLVTGLWVRRNAGGTCGVFASAVLLVEPSIRAHACIVHSDILVTLFLVSSAAALDRATPGRGLSRGWLVGSGFLYGGALVSKYSTLPFLALFASVAWIRIAARRGTAPGSSEAGREGLLRAGALVALAVVVPALSTLVLVQQAAAGTTPPAELGEAIRRSVEDRAFQPVTSRTRMFLSATEHLPAGLAAYAAGLEWVERGNRPGSRVNYFLGKVSGKGFLWYFPVALALKLTTATVAFVLISLAATVAGLLRAAGRGRLLFVRLVRGRAFLPLTLGLSYLGLAMLASVNIGVRHVLPAAVLLLAGLVIAIRLAASRRRHALTLLLAATVILSAAEARAFRGQEISFGNLIAGGARGLRSKLSDSNVDWGAGQARLFDRVRRGDLGRVASFTMWIDPDQARELRIENLEGPLTTASLCSYDAVFVSVYFWDSLSALERCPETWENYEYLRGTYGPALELPSCFAVEEEVGPEYLLFRRGVSGRNGRAAEPATPRDGPGRGARGR